MMLSLREIFSLEKAKPGKGLLRVDRDIWIVP